MCFVTGENNVRRLGWLLVALSNLWQSQTRLMLIEVTYLTLNYLAKVLIHFQ